jgi:hypothetical protein
VVDDDGAHVVGIGPRTGRWATWLELETVLDFLVLPPAWDDENNVTHVDWDDPDHVRERAEMRRCDFVDEVFFGLLRTLGLPWPR